MVTALLQIAPPEHNDVRPDLHWSQLETSMPLDRDEWAAVEAFARAGLISAAEAGGARAHSTPGHRAVG